MLVGRKYLAALTPEQAVRATEISDVCRFVWNLALEQRREYRKRGAWANYNEQSRQLTELRRAESWIAGVPQGSVAWALRDLERACKRHGTHRVQWKSSRNEHRGFTCRARRYIRVERINRRWGRVRVEGMGWIKFRMTRDLGGEIRNVTVSRDAGRWYASIQVEDGLVATEPNGPAVGIDRGVVVAIATSDGDMLNREFATTGERTRIKRLQQQLARQQTGSNRRAQTRAKLQRTHARIRARRDDFCMRTAHNLATDYGLIAVEDLRVANMTRGNRGLNRSILDKGWGRFLTNLEHQARYHGAEVVRVNPAYTSQTCSACNHVASESRESQASFRCVSCGHTAHADTNAAMNILAAGYAVSGRGDCTKAACEASTSQPTTPESGGFQLCQSKSRRSQQQEPTQ